MTVSVRDGRGLARRWPKEGKLYYLYSDKRNTRSQYQGQSKPFFHGYSVIKGYPESAVPALESEMKWLPLAPKTVTWYTELRKSLCRWLRECYRQVEAVVVSNSRNKLHQTTYKDFFSPLYSQFQKSNNVAIFLSPIFNLLVKIEGKRNLLT